MPKKSLNRTGPIRENRLVSEWMNKAHPYALQWRRVRVGPAGEGAEGRMYGIIRRWADIVFKDGDGVHLVEAKMRPDPGAISQLQVYAKLFPQTPEFRDYWGEPLFLHFLTTSKDPVVLELAQEFGIAYEIYAPAWAKKYLDDLIIKKRRP